MAIAFVVYAIGLATIFVGVIEFLVTGWAAFAVAVIGIAIFCVGIYIEEKAVQSEVTGQAGQ